MYKEAAKWLLTFVPISTVVALALTLASRFDGIEAVGLWNWINEFPWISGAVLATVAATVVVIVMCCRVLLAEAGAWNDLRSDADWLSKAFSEHAVGIPLFKDSSAYEAADLKETDGQATSAEQTALATTSRRILELSEAENARAKFEKFTWCYSVCAVVIVVGLGVATAGLPSTPDAVTKPTKVSILMQPGTENQFVATTGCASLDDTTAIAVGGLWSKPELRLIGQGCPAGDWTPPDDLGAVVAPK